MNYTRDTVEDSTVLSMEAIVAPIQTNLTIEEVELAAVTQK